MGKYTSPHLAAMLLGMSMTIDGRPVTLDNLLGRKPQKTPPRERELTAADIERIQAAEQKRERKRQKALSSS